ncbi:hypothetical protein LTR05_006400 [Lithohypha guttulata]|uniref:Uncharacterized protein n=1 Tax=Lithohypha guttulata TaxID=1690604 RepID=A0AAN7Y5Q1_9EURO|nr:hypothetical protein LTR05_006400 [Lithohypha guttulata]
MAKNNSKQTSSQMKPYSPLPASGGQSSAGIRTSTRLNKTQKPRLNPPHQTPSTLPQEVDPSKSEPTTKASKRKSPPSTISWGSPDEGVDEGDEDFDEEQFQAGGACQRASNSSQSQEDKEEKSKKVKKARKSKQSSAGSKIFPEDIEPETPGLTAATARDVATDPIPELVIDSSGKKRKRSDDEMSNIPSQKRLKPTESVDLAEGATAQQPTTDTRISVKASKKSVEIEQVVEEEPKLQSSLTTTAPQVGKRKVVDIDDEDLVATAQRPVKKPRSKPAASLDETVDKDGPSKPTLPKLQPKSSTKHDKKVSRSVSDLKRSRAMPKTRTSAYNTKKKVVPDTLLADLEAGESPAVPNDEDVFGDPIFLAEDALTRVRAETESSSRLPSLTSDSVRPQGENRSARREIEIFKDKNNSLTKALKSCGYNPEKLNEDFVKSQGEQPTFTAGKEKIDRTKREYLPLPKKVGVFDNLMNQPSKSHPDKKPPPPKGYKKDYKGRGKENIPPHE